MSSSQETTRSLEDAPSSSQNAQLRSSLSQHQERRRRRSAPPPARLQWPAGGTGLRSVVSSSHPLTQTTINAPAFTNNNTNNNENKSRPTKRPRNSTLFHSANDNHNDTMMMWVDRYAPTSSADLCVAPKKVKQISEWIQEATISSTNLSNYAPKKLLVLVGSPGIGKSTMVRVLARELHVELLEWSDSYSNQYNDDNQDYFMTQQQMMQVDRTTPLQLFQQFLQSSGFGFSSLELSSSTAAGGLQFAALRHHNNDRVKQPKKKPPPLSFTQQSTTTATTAPTKSMILLEELPNAHHAEGQAQLRQILSQHVTSATAPTVLIYSEGSEGHSNPYDLERLIDPAVLYSPGCQIVQINPVTTARLKKSIESIVKTERLPMPKDRIKSLAEELHAASGGDLRFAINSLQFDQAGQGKSQRSFLGRGHAKATAADKAPATPRDVKLTAFHALGKLLYAKRVKGAPPALPGDDRPPLDFDPEKVLDHCDLDLSSAMNFLEFHSGDFFTDITEWSRALEYYSDASWLLDQSTNYSYLRKNRGGSGANMTSPIFPEGYVASLAGRAVAHANRHPAPSKFRSLTAPKIGQVIRLRNDNDATFRRLQKRLVLLNLNSPSMLQDCVGTTNNFVTDRLPYMRQIVPTEVESYVNQLHSSVSATTDYMNGWNRAELHHQQGKEEARLDEQQREILEMDDIIDFDSRDEDEQNKVPARSSSMRRPNNIPKALFNPYRKEPRQPATSTQSSQNLSQYDPLPPPVAASTKAATFSQQQSTQDTNSTVPAPATAHDPRVEDPCFEQDEANEPQSSQNEPPPPSPPRQQFISNNVEVIVIDDTPPPPSQRSTQSEMVYIDV